MATPESLSMFTTDEKNAIEFLQWAGLTTIPAFCRCGHRWQPQVKNGNLVFQCGACLTPEQKTQARARKAEALGKGAPTKLKNDKRKVKCNEKVAWHSYCGINTAKDGNKVLTLPVNLKTTELVQQMLFFANMLSVEHNSAWASWTCVHPKTSRRTMCVGSTPSPIS